MKVVILSGSPKGKLSVTLEYWVYIARKFPEHEFEHIHIGQRIKAIENKAGEFEKVLANIDGADLVVWIFPVYYTLIPSQLKRFIELIWERNAQESFKGKYTTVFSTSIHFFDTAAHDYLEMVCDDLGMQYICRYSADMYEIFQSKYRKQILNYTQNLFTAIEKKEEILPCFSPLIPTTLNYEPQPIKDSEIIDSKGKNVVILTDEAKKETPDTNIGKMISQLKKIYSPEASVIYIEEIKIKGPCIGCMKCSYDNTCVYEGKEDDFNEFWRNEIVEKADILIIAGTIIDRYLSSTWKKLFDRCYFMNHTPVLKDKQIGFLVSGPVGQIPFIPEIFRGWVEFQGSNYLGYVSDERDNSSQVKLLMNQMAERSIRYHDMGYKTPPMFLAESTMRMFRDDVYSRLRFVCQADHRHYQENGFYDSFPQNDKFSKKMNRKMMFLTKVSKKVRKYLYDNCTVELWKPIHRAAIDPRK